MRVREGVSTSVVLFLGTEKDGNSHMSICIALMRLCSEMIEILLEKNIRQCFFPIIAVQVQLVQEDDIDLYYLVTGA